MSWLTPRDEPIAVVPCIDDVCARFRDSKVVTLLAYYHWLVIHRSKGHRVYTSYCRDNITLCKRGGSNAVKLDVYIHITMSSNFSRYAPGPVSLSTMYTLLSDTMRWDMLLPCFSSFICLQSVKSHWGTGSGVQVVGGALIPIKTGNSKDY